MKSIAVFLALAGAASAQTPAADIEIVPVRGHIYLLAGAGANITLSVGPDGVFMVDAGLPQFRPQRRPARLLRGHQGRDA